jgi:hypothetical protein
LINDGGLIRGFAKSRVEQESRSSRRLELLRYQSKIREVRTPISLSGR